MKIDLFTIALACIATHELDAVRCREWRILPGFSLLPDRWGKLTFIILHIPVFFLVFRAYNQGDAGFRKGFDIFLIVHLFLHLLLLRHRNNEFKDFASWFLITGAALFALADLFVGF